MGLFDRKRPEEEVPARQPAPAPAAKPEPAKPVAVEKEPEPVRRAAPQPAPEPAKPTYGIQNAIELMRQLPDDNVQLVVEVVKKTLESLHVDIASIIADAERKHQRIDERVANLQAEIADYEEEIAARQDEIEALTADRDETDTVRTRLELAQRSTAASNSPRPSASIPPPGDMTSGTIG